MADVTDSEIVLIHNTLNEILNGLPETIRVKNLLAYRDTVSELMKEWSRCPDLGLVLANGPLIVNCIQTVIEELGDAEFDTRIGVSIPAAQDFINYVRGTLT